MNPAFDQWLLDLARDPRTDSMTLGRVAERMGLDAGQLFNMQYALGAYVDGGREVAQRLQPQLEATASDNRSPLPLLLLAAGAFFLLR